MRCRPDCPMTGGYFECPCPLIRIEEADMTEKEIGEHIAGLCEAIEARVETLRELEPLDDRAASACAVEMLMGGSASALLLGQDLLANYVARFAAHVVSSRGYPAVEELLRRVRCTRAQTGTRTLS